MNDDIEKRLMDIANCRSAKSIEDDLVKNSPGLYCIRITDIYKLPNPYNEVLNSRGHNILYIGKATKSLKKRLNQELRAKGHGTFFRSLGAILGYRPERSLKDKKNKRNYKFSKNDDEKHIINWINDNLKVNWVEFKGDFGEVETTLIKEYFPLMNIAKNPKALKVLKDLRKECVMIAKE